MPAASPRIAEATRIRLATLGSAIRDRRKQLGVSMTTTAESAGVSRVTLHRIERGAPAVTIGAYLNVIAALGLRLDITDSDATPTGIGGGTGDAETEGYPGSAVHVADYPQLRQIAWQLSDDTKLTEAEALHLYERNWRHVDQSAMDKREREFLQRLIDTWGHGTLLV
jgi:transcriptional regulator with XRE-family HTH domain